MNHYDIKMFLAIVRAGSLSQAATYMFVTQSAISQQLKSLEDELGTTLFLRKKGQRSLTLTASGDRFYKIAKDIDVLMDESLQLKNMAEMRPLSIHAVGSVNSGLFQGLYRRLSMLEPSLTLRLSTGKTPAIYRSIVDRSFDVGFVHRDLKIKSVDALPIFQEALYLVSDRADWKALSAISPKELDPSEELRFSWSTEFNDWHNYWFDPSIPPHIQLDYTALLCPLLLETNYWAIVPASILKILQSSKTLTVTKLTDPPPPRICYMVTAKNRKIEPHSPISICREMVRSLVEEDPYLKVL